MKSVLYLFGIVLVSVSAGAIVRNQQRDIIRVRNVMDAKTFQAAGLHKLTPSELQQLDLWATDFRNTVTQIVVDKVNKQAQATSVIETQIDGEFKGWDGDTIFKLANGQIWQQSSYDYTYEYDYNPDVLIYKSGRVYKMHVKGVKDVVEVKRLK